MSMNTSREQALQEQLDWFDNESEMGRSPIGASLRQSIIVDYAVEWMSYDWKKYNILNKKKLSEIEQEIYVGCYSSSKQYIGPKKAKKYCLCTLKKLNEKYNDEQINEVFKQKPEKIIEATKFASLYCEKQI